MHAMTEWQKGFSLFTYKEMKLFNIYIISYADIKENLQY